MKVNSSVRGTVLLAFSVAAIAEIGAAIISGSESQNGAGPQVFRQPAEETTANQRDLSAQAAKNDSDDATAFASIAEREISQLDKTTTLGKWLALHSKDQRWVKSAKAYDLECLSYVKRDWLPSGAILALAVYFYPPRAPSPAVLPTLSGQELMNSACTLGKIRVETEARTPEIGRAIAQAVQQRFSKAYGESIGNGNVAFWGRSYYTDAARWIHNAEIVCGYDAKPGQEISSPGEILGGPTAFVHARLPIVHDLEHEACCTLKAYHYRPIERMEFHRADAVAGVGDDLSERFEKLYEEIFQASASAENAHQPEHLGWLESLAPVLRDWLTALKTLQPAQRAAGLVAADLMVAAGQYVDGAPLGLPKKLHPRAELQQLGAVFERNDLGGYYEYKSNWLEQARELDPEGEAGQMAKLVSLVRPSCDPRKVILDGEQLLKKGIDVPTATQLHFIVGDAYSDIVALAAGAADADYADYDPAKFRDEAGPAGTKGLEQYRAGLAVDATSENAKDAWRQAWHLAAGLIPSTRNVCIGD